ncbi:hypothetical protein [Variovorax sp. CF079]|uniref:hypothetical protein n=1 Tax=Variovorax sp. CF079 TaxID=1882774 RepID=UPI000B84CBC7|nr:hypothetical protein [Variovorax sp. CF079]
MTAGVVATACGGGGGGGGGGFAPSSGGGDAPPAAKSVTGVFLDSAVEGLDYMAGSSAKAVTSAKGEFVCKEGETVRFSLGALVLGSATCGAAITPLTLANLQATAAGVKADKVVNRLFARDRQRLPGGRGRCAHHARQRAGAADAHLAAALRAQARRAAASGALKPEPREI